MTDELKQKLNDAYGKGQEEWRAIRWRGSKERTRFHDEFGIIAHWVKGLAVLCFLAFQAVPVGIYLTDKNPPPIPLLVLMGALAGALLAAVVLLFGYINRDAKRRGMNATLWTLLAIIVPYLIGVIIYFIVREPRPFDCPQCGATVSARFNYCPSCKYNLRPTCPQCKREVRLGDKFCPNCAFELEASTSARPPAGDAAAQAGS
jgi:Double zinc ribbon